MSLFKNKGIEVLSLTLVTTLLLTSTGSSPVYAATPISTTSASQTTISLMQSSKPDMSTTAQEAKDIKITLNGKPVSLSDPILNDKGSTLLPIRSIGELLGVTVNYDADHRVAIASDSDTVLEVPLGYNFGILNGTKKGIPNTKSIVYNSRTYLPVRFVAESLDVKIEYIAKTRTVAITTEQATQSPTETPTQTPTQKPTETPTPTTGNSPQELFDANKSVADADPSYFKSFKSIEEVKKLIPLFPEKDSLQLILDEFKYTTVKLDILSDSLEREGQSLDFSQYSGCVKGQGTSDEFIMFKDGTHTERVSRNYPDGKTLEDVAYFAYRKGDKFIFVQPGKIAMDKLPNW
ncbi:MAG: copper amine oxidase N-terminal domain-containing protein [Cellulosilyticum sp.]|nr:copper amine oxidase N-terminal domain-containing protein [Cellulosilyticum sp.]